MEWSRRAGGGGAAMQDDGAPMTKARVRAKFDEVRPPRARKISGWPKKYKLAQVFLWEYS